MDLKSTLNSPKDLVPVLNSGSSDAPIAQGLSTAISTHVPTGAPVPTLDIEHSFASYSASVLPPVPTKPNCPCFLCFHRGYLGKHPSGSHSASALSHVPIKSNYTSFLCFHLGYHGKDCQTHNLPSTAASTNQGLLEQQAISAQPQPAYSAPSLPVPNGLYLAQTPLVSTRNKFDQTRLDLLTAHANATALHHTPSHPGPQAAEFDSNNFSRHLSHLFASLPSASAIRTAIHAISSHPQLTWRIRASLKLLARISRSGGDAAAKKEADLQLAWYVGEYVCGSAVRTVWGEWTLPYAARVSVSETNEWLERYCEGWEKGANGFYGTTRGVLGFVREMWWGVEEGVGGVRRDEGVVKTEEDVEMETE